MQDPDAHVVVGPFGFTLRPPDGTPTRAISGLWRYLLAGFSWVVLARFRLVLQDLKIDSFDLLRSGLSFPKQSDKEESVSQSCAEGTLLFLVGITP